jgi:hypothetical protein
MHDPRWEAAAVLLPSGKVLVAGGATNTSLATIRTAELYDPATGAWISTGSMSQERQSFTLTLLPSGKVMAAGGTGTNGPVASAELFDPASGAWTSTGSLQIARASHTATLLANGTVLVAGGTGATPAQSTTPVDAALASSEIYDPATGSWTPTGSLGQARLAHTATLMPNGKVLVAGGESFFGTVFPTSAEVYDPAAGKWSPTLPLLSGRSAHITVLLPNGKILVAGGLNTSDTGPNTELFDPASAVATPTLLTPPTQVAGAIEFRFRNTPGLSFTVLSTTNLAVPLNNWTSAGTALETSPGHYQFTDTTATDPQRFYRTRSD